MNRFLFGTFLFFLSWGAVLELWGRNRSDLKGEVDGGGKTSLQYRLAAGPLDLGGYLKYLPQGRFEGMAGLNLPFLALGNIKERGLLKEVRDPGPEALARGGERTRWRGDTLAVSPTSIGAALFPWPLYGGAAYIKREETHSLTLWGRPLARERVEGEVLVMGAYEARGAPPEDWYPDKQALPLGYRGLGALKVSVHFPGLVMANTLMLSAGAGLRPGFLGALAFNAWRGAWLLRSRIAIRTPYFRDAGGDRPPGGFAGSFSLRPRRGLQTAVSYQVQRGEDRIFDDEGGFKLGWRGEGGMVNLGIVFDTLAAAPLEDETRRPRSYAMTGTLFRPRGEGQIKISWDKNKGFEGKLRGDFGTGLEFSGYLEGKGRLWKEKVFLSFQGGLKMSLSQWQLGLDLDIDEFSPAESSWEPKDFRLSLRWIQYF